MSTNPPNAILAISSLDRFITSIPTTVSTRFLAIWENNSNTLTLFDGAPLVGAVATSFLIPGIANATIVSIEPFPPQFGSIITISNNTTAAQPTPAFVTQVYTIPTGGSTQPVNNSLIALYRNPQAPPYGNDFTIQSPSALIYGYINRIIISQIQIQYNIPTVNFDLNDRVYIISGGTYYDIRIPYGFYYPDELAATMESLFATEFPAGMIDVSYSTRNGFTFKSMAEPPVDFYFPTYNQLTLINFITTPLVTNVLKTMKMLGMSAYNNNSTYIQTSVLAPNFIYTPYIDFYSDVLTNYQIIKDTDTSATKRKGLLARVYLSGSNTVQTTGGASGTLGCAPFVVTADLNTPKVIRWTPDVAIPSIDFQLRDCYGDLIPGFNNFASFFGGNIGDLAYNTEFDMTLLCIEGPADY